MNSTSRAFLRWIPALIFMAVIFYFSSINGHDVSVTTQPVLENAPKEIQLTRSSRPLEIQWLKVAHFVGYAGLWMAFVYALEGEKGKTAWIALALVAVYALTDELHQSFIPKRSASLRDVEIDLLPGLVMATALEARVLWNKAKIKYSSDASL